MHNTRLRAVLAKMELEISRLPAGDGLRAPWAELVELLAVGPAPVVRECPTCKRTVMAAATRCGYCWSTLSPTAAAR